MLNWNTFVSTSLGPKSTLSISLLLTVLTTNRKKILQASGFEISSPKCLLLIWAIFFNTNS